MRCLTAMLLLLLPLPAASGPPIEPFYGKDKSGREVYIGFPDVVRDSAYDSAPTGPAETVVTEFLATLEVASQRPGGTAQIFDSHRCEWLIYFRNYRKTISKATLRCESSSPSPINGSTYEARGGRPTYTCKFACANNPFLVLRKLPDGP